MRRISTFLLAAGVAALAYADPAPAPKAPVLPAALKAARTKTFAIDKLQKLRVVAQGVLDTKEREAAAEPGNQLAAELDALRNTLNTELMARRVAPLVPAGDISSPSAPSTHGPRVRFADVAAPLGQARAVAAAGPVSPRVSDALKQAEQLESEVRGLDSAPEAEQGERIRALVARLTSHRASEFSQSSAPQPTLSIAEPFPPKDQRKKESKE